MPTKTAVKKTVRKGSQTAKKSANKASKKVTWDDIQEGFRELEKSQKEAWAAIRETQQATQKAKDEAWAAIRETQQAQKEAENARIEAEKARIEAEKTTQKAKDEAWAAIRETQQAHKETEKANIESNLRIEKAMLELKEGSKELQKGSKEMQKAVKDTQKNIGGLNNTLGSIAEHILTPGLPQKFKKIGYSFNRIATYKFAEGVYAQIDGMLENGELAIAVEVKVTLRKADIDDHLLRMEKIRKHANEHGDKRQFMGAMASTITDDSNRNYALKKGLFVIEPSGEDVKVFKPDGEPRVW
ncbi:hypothetical protein R84B8_01053 [Treponema sp. R8-4-B8]